MALTEVTVGLVSSPKVDVGVESVVTTVAGVVDRRLALCDLMAVPIRRLDKMVMSGKSRNSQHHDQRHRRQGNGQCPAEHWISKVLNPPSGGCCAEFLRPGYGFIDANGDGVVDLVGSEPAHSEKRSWLSNPESARSDLLKEYKNGVSAALVERADEAPLQPRFRVLKLPSLALCVGGETLEVIPGVRDWGDYIRAFRRYLGNTGTQTSTGSN